MDIIACTSIPIVIRRVTLKAVHGKSISIGPNNDGFEVSSTVAEKLVLGQTYIIMYIPYEDLRVNKLLLLGQETRLETVILVGKNTPWEDLYDIGKLRDAVITTRPSR